jgi:hypothetical protein
VLFYFCPAITIRYPPPSADNDPQLARTELAELGQAQSARAVHKAAHKGVVAGEETTRSNALVEAVNGLLEQAKRAARGFRTSRNFIAIVCVRMSKLQHLPAPPFASSLAT